jgi:hypothetical protein
MLVTVVWRKSAFAQLDVQRTMKYSFDAKNDRKYEEALIA